jgi:hypothetical protein
MTLITTTLEASPEIVQGLSTGDYVRFGGVVRAKDTGRQIAHLREAGQGVQQLPSPIRAASGLTQIAAGASILNLGVSAVGFAVMFHKLNKLDESIRELQGQVQAGFDQMSDRFDRVDQQLGYLVVRADEQQIRQQILQRDVSLLLSHSITDSFEEARAQVQRHMRFGPSGNVDTVTKLDSIARQLQAKALSFSPSLEPETTLNVDMCLQGWVAAAALEADELYAMRRQSDAMATLAELEANTNLLANNWVTGILEEEPRKELQTAARYAIRPLHRGIKAERVQRIAGHSKGDRDLDSASFGLLQRDAKVEADMDGKSHDQVWTNRQVGAAAFLDLLAETADRAATHKLLASQRQSDGGELDAAMLRLDSAEPNVYAIRQVESSSQ